MNARKAFDRARRGGKEGRRHRDHWDDDDRAIRRKDHRRSRRTSKRVLCDFDDWGIG